MFCRSAGECRTEPILFFRVSVRPDILGGGKHACACGVSQQRAAICHNGYAGGVLPEVHSGAGIASRPAGTDLSSHGCCAAQMEAQHTVVYRFGNGGIHAADPVGVRLNSHEIPLVYKTHKASEKNPG